MLELKIPVSVKLSEWLGVVGCGWTSSMSGVRMTVPSWAFTNSDPTSSSKAEDMKLSRMTEAAWSGPLGMGSTEGGFDISGGWSLR